MRTGAFQAGSIQKIVGVNTATSKILMGQLLTANQESQSAAGKASDFAFSRLNAEFF